MDCFFISEISEADVKRERDKSRDLRKTQWWQNRIAKGICYWCGSHFKKEELTMDHIVPIARGGKATRGNVVPACKDCNNRKKYLLPQEWDEYLQKKDTQPQ